MDFPHYDDDDDLDRPQPLDGVTYPSRFGRGWIPAGRDIGLPAGGDDAAFREEREGRVPEVAADAGQRVTAGGQARAMPPAPRHDGWTPERKVRFLGRLADEGNVRAACAAVGLSPEAAYRLRRRDALFAGAWAAALVAARAHAEQVLADRAIHGSEEQVWFRGELVGVRRRHDGRLLLAHLARLDRMAEETPAGRRAARFDEVLALVAGETFAPEMADREDAGHFDPDPLLPMARERYVEAAGREGALDLWGEALEALMAGAVARSRAPEDWHTNASPETWLSAEERAELHDAEDLGGERGRIAGGAAWDAWRAHAAAVAERCEHGEGGGTAEQAAGDAGQEADGAAASGLPVEYKSCAGPDLCDCSLADCSLDTINSVNFAVPAAEGLAAGLVAGLVAPGFTARGSGRILRQSDAGESRCPRQPTKRHRPGSSPTLSACGKNPTAFPAPSGAGSLPVPCGRITG